MGKTNIKDKWKSLIEKHGKNKVYGGISAIVLVLLLCGFGITWAMTSSPNDLKKENQTVEVSTKKDTKEKIKAALPGLLRKYFQLKGRNSLRSNSLPFLTPKTLSTLNTPTVRPGNHAA